eukprot:TRINITY_DN10451_c0_g1_i1.p1 TRINITY_DN10451_c0_g1~~TRINITY_DN10451_c0_g1_i1.p1  ORF type:complete len:252 (-),score=14.58 TRINITY_DN10451_c0_g1_i1:213-968(-)
MPRFEDFVALAFHWFSAILNTLSLAYLFTFPNGDFGWYYRFLTIWGLTLQAIYFYLCGIIDLIHLRRGAALDYHFPLGSISSRDSPFSKQRTVLERHRDRFFASIAFPLGNFVGLGFWLLIFPTVVNIIEFMPGGFWLAFHQHGITWISILLEASCIYHEYGRKRVELPIWIGFIAVYLTWNLSVSITTGKWIYPFQQMLASNVAISIAVYAGLFLLASGLYMICRLIHVKYWTWSLTSLREREYSPLQQT